MSKSTNGLGQFRGKLGGVVYAVRNGQQIVRAYQPVVANPKSTAQCIQRAKGNLVGRISKITPFQILEGLGSNRSLRRSRFLRLLLEKVTAGPAAGDPSTFNAKLADADFIFSEGFLAPVHYVNTANADEFNVFVSLSTYTNVPSTLASSQGLLVVVVIKQSTGKWEEIQYRFVTPEELEGGSFNVQFIHLSMGAYTASIYAAPFGTADGSKLPTISGDLTSTATSLDAILDVGTSASSVIWGTSSFVRNTTFTPA